MHVVRVACFSLVTDDSHGNSLSAAPERDGHDDDIDRRSLTFLEEVYDVVHLICGSCM